MKTVISGKTCPLLQVNCCLEGVTTSFGVSSPKYLCAVGMLVHFSVRKASLLVCNAWILQTFYTIFRAILRVNPSKSMRVRSCFFE